MTRAAQPTNAPALLKSAYITLYYTDTRANTQSRILRTATSTRNPAEMARALNSTMPVMCYNATRCQNKARALWDYCAAMPRSRQRATMLALACDLQKHADDYRTAIEELKHSNQKLRQNAASQI